MLQPSELHWPGPVYYKFEFVNNGLEHSTSQNAFVLPKDYYLLLNRLGIRPWVHSDVDSEGVPVFTGVPSKSNTETSN